MISRLISKRTIMGMAKRHCDKISVVGVMTAAATKDRRMTVSYTHLTLPTILLV